MSTWPKVLLALVLALPVSAYAAGSFIARGAQPPVVDPVVIQDGPPPDIQEGRTVPPKKSGDAGTDEADDEDDDDPPDADDRDDEAEGPDDIEVVHPSPQPVGDDDRDDHDDRDDDGGDDDDRGGDD